MNVYRRIAAGVTTCAAGLAATACTAGITSVGQSSSRPPATHRATPSPSGTTAPPASASASPGPVDTVSVTAPIGSFPVPPGAQVLANMMPCGKQVIIELGSVTPSKASSFYTSELPRAGYTITSSFGSAAPGASGSLVEISFTGHHGYQGLIVAAADLSSLASSGPSPVGLPSSMTKNFAEITLTPPGAAGTGCGG